MNNEAALVVFSGGQDSTTCLFWGKNILKSIRTEFYIRAEACKRGGAGS